MSYWEHCIIRLDHLSLRLRFVPVIRFFFRFPSSFLLFVFLSSFIFVFISSLRLFFCLIVDALSSSFDFLSFFYRFSSSFLSSVLFVFLFLFHLRLYLLSSSFHLSLHRRFVLVILFFIVFPLVFFCFCFLLLHLRLYLHPPSFHLSLRRRVVLFIHFFFFFCVFYRFPRVFISFFVPPPPSSSFPSYLRLIMYLFVYAYPSSS